MASSDDRYKEFIDTLVLRSPSPLAWRYREGHWESGAGTERFNRFVESLDDEQRLLLESVLDEERFSAIHDALFVLVDRRMRLSDDLGELQYPMSEELHGDYVYRFNGNPWYDEH